MGSPLEPDLWLRYHVSDDSRRFAGLQYPTARNQTASVSRGYIVARARIFSTPTANIVALYDAVHEFEKEH